MTQDRKTALMQTATLVAATLAAILVLNFLLGLACRAVLLHSSFRLSRASHAGTDVKVLVVGNSRGVNLLDASQLEPKLFNLSYNGLSGETIVALTKDFFQAGNHADAVVLETSGLISSGTNCELKSFWTILPNLAQASRASCGTDTMAARWFPLTIYNSEQFLRAIYYEIGHANDQAWANDYSMTAAACADPPLSAIREHMQKPLPAEIARSQRNLADLRQWLAAHHIRTHLVLVTGPYLILPDTSAAIARVQYRIHATFGNAYLDLARGLPGKCALFSDMLHVNRDGRPMIRQRILDYALKGG